MSMTLSRTFLLALSATAGLLSCGDASPCSSCPSVGGVYAMSWTRTSTTCPLVVPEPVTITLGQVRSTLTAQIGAQTVQGTLYDSYDFILTGFAGSSQLVMRGYAVPGTAGFADAGSTLTKVTLNGTLSTSDLTSDAGCSGTDSFVGTRNLQ